MWICRKRSIRRTRKNCTVSRGIFSSKRSSIKGKKVVVSAGPTRERIDPVRFFTNFSQGKWAMQWQKQQQNLEQKQYLFQVLSVLEPPTGVQVVPVESAEDMFEAVIEYFDTASIVIKTAAVADYRPIEIHAQKMKKQPEKRY